MTKMAPITVQQQLRRVSVNQAVNARAYSSFYPKVRVNKRYSSSRRWCCGCRSMTCFFSGRLSLIAIHGQSSNPSPLAPDYQAPQYSARRVNDRLCIYAPRQPGSPFSTRDFPGAPPPRQHHTTYRTH